MRILIVSWYFPPANTIGALRVAGFARFLSERGHDIGVVAGKNWGHPETLTIGFPLERIAYTDAIDVNDPPARLRRSLRWIAGQRSTSAGASPASNDDAARPHEHSPRSSILRRASDFYVTLTNVPDNRIGWLPRARRAGRRLCRHWTPELIFASGPPFTALLAACSLSAHFGVPWVAELRDRWADDVYGEAPAWRMRIDHWLERRTLSSAAALVTVTDPWAEFYRRKYDMPVASIYNGYEPADFSKPDPASGLSDPHLVIGYTGGIYPGKRDPTPLFDALRSLGERRERFRVVFCGTDPALVLPLAARAGVTSLVEVRPSVHHGQAIEFQRRSDVLLLMQWNDPREQGNCPGKFFEYIGSLRPILVLGLEDGVPATIVKQRAAGFCANDPPLIAAQLERWLKEKEEFGRVPALPQSARDGLSRDIQFQKLEAFLQELPHVGR